MNATKYLPAFALALAGFAVAAPAAAQDVPEAAIERVYGSPTARIASMALVPEGSRLVFVSGTTPAPLDPANPEDFGDTRTQTISVLERIKAALEAQGLGLGDLVKLTVFLVGTPETGGRMDSAAMNEVFATYFGTPEQPNRPTRSTIQIAALGREKMYVEIEGIAAVAP
ncbi:Rid family hydrolase [Alteraurantiacibacter buctensis]|uniref:Endonuclease n=1 Tax=Alteraurantiacibacter buctensis TaxID=1503981 RepID=A0A844YTW4_9SPHN|nr:Rid family hydrolase [Alteraurantiacibacter buctensis]MXO70999.1 endonuclease [Alteraurantiacibacter buctensis]